MFPKLSDLINYMFGSHLDLPVQTYGFFLALGFLVGGITLRSELKRKEEQGLLYTRHTIVDHHKPAGWAEFVLGIMLSSAIGWKFFGIITNYSTFSSDPQGYILSGKGSVSAMLVIVMIATAYHFFTLYRASKHPGNKSELLIHPHQNTWNLMLVAIISAIIGSKIFDILDNFGSFLQSPIHDLFSFSGLTFYGGFIVTVIVLLVYVKIIKLDWKHVIDSSAPVIMIGYAIGRLGCHFSGDGCWGIANTLVQPNWLGWVPDWFWAYDFPHNVANQGIRIPGCTGHNCMVLSCPVFPTSLYESLISLGSFCILWFQRKRIKAPVVLFGLFMILNGTERFIIEKIRVNHKYDFLGLHLTQAEIISTGLIIGGILVMIYFSKQYHKHLSDKINITIDA